MMAKASSGVALKPAAILLPTADHENKKATSEGGLTA